MTLGRSMTVLGFAILLVAALSGCGKKESVGDATVDVFQVALPDRDNPRLRDLTAYDLGEAFYEMHRLGLQIASWPAGKRPSFSAHLRHDLAVNGRMDLTQDQVVGSAAVAPPYDIGLDFDLYETVNLQAGGEVVSHLDYNVVLQSDHSVKVYKGSGPGLSKIAQILTPEYKVARGVYESPSDRTTAFVIETEIGFSLYFLVYDNDSRVLGRIDYLRAR